MFRQININDVLFSGENLARGLIKTMLNKDYQELKAKGSFGESEITDIVEKHSWENALKSDYGFKVLMYFVHGCIWEYHEQLREILLEYSIDIGEIDLETPSRLKEEILKRQCDEDEE